MKLSTSPVAVGATILVTTILAACARETPDMAGNDGAAAAYVTLDADLTAFKADFNELSDKIRLVFISGPSCGVCLRGMDDLNEAVVGPLQDDPRVHTLVLYVPTLGAEERHVAAAMPLMQGPRVSHYWDPEGLSGLQFQKTLEIDLYAWDVWMLYEPGVTWEPDSGPPAPAFWQHQLPGLPESQRLDAAGFAAEVTERLDGTRSSGR